MKRQVVVTRGISVPFEFVSELGPEYINSVDRTVKFYVIDGDTSDERRKMIEQYADKNNFVRTEPGRYFMFKHISAKAANRYMDYFDWIKSVTIKLERRPQ